MAALAAVALGVALLFLWNVDDNGPEPQGAGPRFATVLPEPLPLPDFALRDQEGEPFTLDSLRGRTSLLFFGFTHCPDICPATLQQLSLARKQIAATTPGTALPAIVLISVDPERDTPEKLEKYVSAFGEDIAGLTGTRESLLPLTSAMGIYFERQPLEGGDYTVSHSTAVLVVDADANLRALFSAPHKTEYFAHDIPLLMAAQ
ncbi:MAG TPA: SCO family protein [Woeseiaceae bacterium]|nr:SCO family protein [Woeseiaceae bacterium]